MGLLQTTLLLSLLGETRLHSGSIHLHSHFSRQASTIDPSTGLTETVAYCSQSAWLLGASIRDNITFGADWDATRYAAVVKACQLETDFKNFDNGDETEVGEKGVACSGGQKARIALARALYSRSKTILLGQSRSTPPLQ